MAFFELSVITATNGAVLPSSICSFCCLASCRNSRAFDCNCATRSGSACNNCNAASAAAALAGATPSEFTKPGSVCRRYCINSAHPETNPPELPKVVPKDPVRKSIRVASTFACSQIPFPLRPKVPKECVSSSRRNDLWRSLISINFKRSGESPFTAETPSMAIKTRRYSGRTSDRIWSNDSQSLWGKVRRRASEIIAPWDKLLSIN